MGGFETHGMTGAGVGAALGLGEHLLAAKRMAGLAKANTMVRDAMLNPELAMALLKRAPIKPGLGSEAVLTKLLARNSMFGATTAARESNRPQQQPAPAYATGGRVAVNGAPTEAQKTAGNYQKGTRGFTASIHDREPEGLVPNWRSRGQAVARPDACRLRVYPRNDGSRWRSRRLFRRARREVRQGLRHRSERPENRGFR